MSETQTKPVDKTLRWQPGPASGAEPEVECYEPYIVAVPMRDGVQNNWWEILTVCLMENGSMEYAYNGDPAPWEWSDVA